jgi:hypothetical protein
MSTSRFVMTKVYTMTTAGIYQLFGQCEWFSHSYGSGMVTEEAPGGEAGDGFPWARWLREQLALVGIEVSDAVTTEQLWGLWQAAKDSGLVPAPRNCPECEALLRPGPGREYDGCHVCGWVEVC